MVSNKFLSLPPPPFHTELTIIVFITIDLHVKFDFLIYSKEGYSRANVIYGSSLIYH